MPRLLLVTSVTTLLSFCAHAAEDYAVPQNEWGQPDLRGVWNFSSDIPMQRPAQFGERQFLTEQEIEELKARQAARDERSDAAIQTGGVDESYNDFWVENAGIGKSVRTSHIIYPPDGQLPDFAEGAIRNQGVYGGDTTGEARPVRIGAGGIGTDGPEDRGLSERCLIGFNAGPPFTPSLYNNNVQIFQNGTHAVIMTEMIHEARIVQLHESAADLPKEYDDRLEQWTGESHGYYDDDTLVVKTDNFNGLITAFGSSGTSEDMVLTEKFTRVDPVTVDYEFTVEAPATYVDKFTAIVPMTRVDGQLYEYACHEGNYGMINVLRGARVQEQLQQEGRE